tara:strand:+ start:352 stop:798 length:447 start_codon:yes stop_codon:yes gene_type:complete
MTTKLPVVDGYVELFGALVPVAALALLLDLERRECCVQLHATGGITVWPPDSLTSDELALGHLYRAHLAHLLRHAGPCTCPRCRLDAGAQVTADERARLAARLAAAGLVEAGAPAEAAPGAQAPVPVPVPAVGDLEALWDAPEAVKGT